MLSGKRRKSLFTRFQLQNATRRVHISLQNSRSNILFFKRPTITRSHHEVNNKDIIWFYGEVGIVESLVIERNGFQA